MNESHLQTNPKHCGYEFITTDDQWWVFLRWDGPICGCMLLEKEDNTFEQAIEWMVNDFKKDKPRIP